MKFNLQSSEKRGQQCTPHELKNLVSTVLFTVFVTHLLKFIILGILANFKLVFVSKLHILGSTGSQMRLRGTSYALACP